MHLRITRCHNLPFSPMSDAIFFDGDMSVVQDTDYLPVDMSHAHIILLCLLSALKHRTEQYIVLYSEVLYTTTRYFTTRCSIRTECRTDKI
jgi:hypothetical protein